MSIILRSGESKKAQNQIVRTMDTSDKIFLIPLQYQKAAPANDAMSSHFDDFAVLPAGRARCGFAKQRWAFQMGWAYPKDAPETWIPR